MSEKTSVTGAYFVGFDKDRNVLLFPTNPEDYESATSKPRKVEQGRPLTAGQVALVSGLVERDGKPVQGHEEDYPLITTNLAREVREELGVLVDPAGFVPFSKVGGNSGRREQVVIQERQGVPNLLAIWSVGFWFYMSEADINAIAQQRPVVKVPIDQLATFLTEQGDAVRPATEYFLWELMRYELDMV